MNMFSEFLSGHKSSFDNISNGRKLEDSDPNYGDGLQSSFCSETDMLTVAFRYCQNTTTNLVDKFNPWVIFAPRQRSSG